MNRFFRFLFHRTIGEQLTLFVMLVTCTTTILMCSAFVIYDAKKMHHFLERELELASNIIAKRLRTGLQFGQQKRLEEALSDYEQNPAIMLACVVDAEGSLIASYKGGEEEPILHCAQLQQDDYDKPWKYITFTRDINSPSGKKLGRLYALSSITPMLEELGRYGYVVFTVFLAALALAYLATIYLKQAITRPMTKLVQLASKVSEGDYDARAHFTQYGEIGQFARLFNTMMDNLRSKKEELEDAIASKERFITNMGHEIRTPNHHMLNFSSMLLRGLQSLRSEMEQEERCDKERIGQYTQKLDMLQHTATRINRASERYARLFHTILDLSKLAEGGGEYHVTKQDLLPIVKQALELHPDINNRATLYAQEAPFNCLADKNKILIVLDHLFSNAAEYAKEGSIEIALTHTEFKNQAGHIIPGIKCSIKDQGIGIPREECELIFECFAESTRTKTQAGGRGLGLALCKEIITTHQGLIWAESDEEGAVFSFVLVG